MLLQTSVMQNKSLGAVTAAKGHLILPLCLQILKSSALGN
jgi:hypothetical protein